MAYLRREFIRKRRKNRFIATALSLGGLLVLLLVGFVVSHEHSFPAIKYINIREGMRKEEVANTFAKTLGWSEEEKQKFLNIHSKATKGNDEGYFFPFTYILPTTANAEEASSAILATFNNEVVAKQNKLQSSDVDIDTIIKIASIIQREAADKNDMKIISGVIWNRLNKGMRLDMDATLQYAKGTTTRWWPVVKSEDKNIDSPFNTYKNKGLPPSAISNPGADAIDAALNPEKTDALFYLHDEYGIIHPAKTYAEHKANVDLYLKQ